MSLRYFEYMEFGPTGVTCPPTTPAAAETVIRLLYAEASFTMLRGDYSVRQSGRSRSDLTAMIQVVDSVSARRAAAWALPKLLSSFQELRDKHGEAELLDRLMSKIQMEEDGQLKGSWQSVAMGFLLLSPAAVDLVSEALEFVESDEELQGYPMPELIATYGLLCMNSYLEEVVSPNEDSQLSREVHLQQAAIALHVSGVYRADRESREQASRTSTIQKVSAARKGHAVRHGPLIQKTLELFDSGAPWKSRRAASLEIWPVVLEYARERGLYLSPDRAQATTYDWIRRHRDE